MTYHDKIRNLSGVKGLKAESVIFLSRTMKAKWNIINQNGTIIHRKISAREAWLVLYTASQL